MAKKELTPQEYIENHKGQFSDNESFKTCLYLQIGYFKRFPEENAHQIKFFEEVMELL
jgi:hypothetical protein